MFMYYLRQASHPTSINSSSSSSSLSPFIVLSFEIRTHIFHQSLKHKPLVPIYRAAFTDLRVFFGFLFTVTLFLNSLL